MPHQKLTDTLASLRHQLQSGEALDAADRQHLEEMMAEIQTLLDNKQAGQAEQSGLGQRLSETVASLEISHPELAATLNELATIFRPL